MKSKINFSPEDIKDLPESLLKELSNKFKDQLQPSKLSSKIISIINDNGGYGNKDLILIMLYRKYKSQHKRSSINQIISILIRKKLLFRIGAGLYSTIDPTLNEGY